MKCFYCQEETTSIPDHTCNVDDLREQMDLIRPLVDRLIEVSRIVLDESECYCSEDGDPSIAGGSYYRRNICPIHEFKEVLEAIEAARKE